MIRRTLLPVLFIACGFVGGMVLTGHLRSAEEARAEQTSAAQQMQPQIIGGLLVSVVLTVVIVPAAYLLVYRRRTPAEGAHS